MFLTALTSSQKQALLRLAHNVVVSDGDLTVTEQVMMEEMRREMDLPADFEATYVDIRGIEKVFDTRKARAIALIALIKLGYSDGAFEIEEECFLRDLSRKFDMSPDQFGLLDNWVRRLIALERELFQLL